MVYWRIDGAMLPLWVASEMGEEGVHAVSSTFAGTFHNVLSTASASSSTNTGVSDNITFATGAQARPTVGRGQPKRGGCCTLQLFAVGIENSAFMTAKMRDYRAYE
jgi:hypothetical protein